MLLYVADTNNQVIRVVDLETNQVETLVLHGIESFTPPADDAAYTGIVVDLDPAEVAAGAGEIELDIALPDGYKVNDEAPSVVDFTVTGGVADLEARWSLTGAELPVSIPVDFVPGSGSITADVTLLYCREDSEGLCILEQVRFTQPIEVGSSGVDRISFPHEVQVPEF